jgi:hypothetical protein
VCKLQFCSEESGFKFQASNVCSLCRDLSPVFIIRNFSPNFKDLAERTIHMFHRDSSHAMINFRHNTVKKKYPIIPFDTQHPLTTGLKLQAYCMHLGGDLSPVFMIESFPKSQRSCRTNHAQVNNSIQLFP